jgi:hypothetical protein
MLENIGGSIAKLCSWMILAKRDRYHRKMSKAWMRKRLGQIILSENIHISLSD